MPPLDPSKRASWTQLEDEILLEHFDGRTRYQLSTSEQLQFFSLRATAADQRNRAALKSRFEIIRRDAKRANERKAREEAGLSVRLEPQDVELPMADEYEEWWFSLPDDDDDEGDEKLGGGMTEVGESEWGEEARDEGWKINANGEIAIRTGKLRIGAGQVMDPVCMDPAYVEELLKYKPLEEFQICHKHPKDEFRTMIRYDLPTFPLHPDHGPTRRLAPTPENPTIPWNAIILPRSMPSFEAGLITAAHRDELGPGLGDDKEYPPLSKYNDTLRGLTELEQYQAGEDQRRREEEVNRQKEAEEAARKQAEQEAAEAEKLENRSSILSQSSSSLLRRLGSLRMSNTKNKKGDEEAMRRMESSGSLASSIGIGRMVDGYPSTRTTAPSVTSSKLKGVWPESVGPSRPSNATFETAQERESFWTADEGVPRESYFANSTTYVTAENSPEKDEFGSGLPMDVVGKTSTSDEPDYGRQHHGSEMVEDGHHKGPFKSKIPKRVFNQSSLQNSPQNLKEQETTAKELAPSNEPNPTGDTVASTLNSGSKPINLIKESTPDDTPHTLYVHPGEIPSSKATGVAQIDLPFPSPPQPVEVDYRTTPQDPRLTLPLRPCRPLSSLKIHLGCRWRHLPRSQFVEYLQFRDALLRIAIFDDDTKYMYWGHGFCYAYLRICLHTLDGAKLLGSDEWELKGCKDFGNGDDECPGTAPWSRDNGGSGPSSGKGNDAGGKSDGYSGQEGEQGGNNHPRQTDRQGYGGEQYHQHSTQRTPNENHNRWHHDHQLPPSQFDEGGSVYKNRYEPDRNVSNNRRFNSPSDGDTLPTRYKKDEDFHSSLTLNFCQDPHRGKADEATTPTSGTAREHHTHFHDGYNLSTAGPKHHQTANPNKGTNPASIASRIPVKGNNPFNPIIAALEEVENEVMMGRDGVKDEPPPVPAHKHLISTATLRANDYRSTASQKAKGIDDVVRMKKNDLRPRDSGFTSAYSESHMSDYTDICADEYFALTGVTPYGIEQQEAQEPSHNESIRHSKSSSWLTPSEYERAVDNTLNLYRDGDAYHNKYGTFFHKSVLYPGYEHPIAAPEPELESEQEPKEAPNSQELDMRIVGQLLPVANVSPHERPPTIILRAMGIPEKTPDPQSSLPQLVESAHIGDDTKPEEETVNETSTAVVLSRGKKKQKQKKRISPQDSKSNSSINSKASPTDQISTMAKAALSRLGFKNTAPTKDASDATSTTAGPVGSKSKIPKVGQSKIPTLMNSPKFLKPNVNTSTSASNHDTAGRGKDRPIHYPSDCFIDLTKPPQPAAASKSKIPAQENPSKAPAGPSTKPTASSANLHVRRQAKHQEPDQSATPIPTIQVPPAATPAPDPALPTPLVNFEAHVAATASNTGRTPLANTPRLPAVPQPSKLMRTPGMDKLLVAKKVEQKAREKIEKEAEMRAKLKPKDFEKWKRKQQEEDEKERKQQLEAQRRAKVLDDERKELEADQIDKVLKRGKYAPGAGRGLRKDGEEGKKKEQQEQAAKKKKENPAMGLVKRTLRGGGPKKSGTKNGTKTEFVANRRMSRVGVQMPGGGMTREEGRKVGFGMRVMGTMIGKRSRIPRQRRNVPTDGIKEEEF